MRKLLAMSLTLLTYHAEAKEKKVHFPVGTFHQNNVNIYGISGGLSYFPNMPENVSTHGINLSLIGEGILAFALPCSPIPNDDCSFNTVWEGDTMVHKIDGINLSGSGTMGYCNINGFSTGYVAQVVNRINGLSVVGMLNYVQVNNGVQAAIFITEAYKMRGLQIGAYNKSHHTRGIQIGLWNVNERRKMPFINWNFRNQPAV
jgi:hypothetical protein